MAKITKKQITEVVDKVCEGLPLRIALLQVCGIKTKEQFRASVKEIAKIYKALNAVPGGWRLKAEVSQREAAAKAFKEKLLARELLLKARREEQNDG